MYLQCFYSRLSIFVKVTDFFSDENAIPATHFWGKPSDDGGTRISMNSFHLDVNTLCHVSNFASLHMEITLEMYVL